MIWDEMKRKMKRLLRRGWRGSDLPTRTPGNEPLIRMRA